MGIKFTKMQGAGNDYVYVSCFSEHVDDPRALAIRVSDRHFGVGSDGLILICPSDKADFRMDMYNSDGSRAQMCGNGIRCVGKYVYDRKLTDKTTITVETGAGVKTLELNVENGSVKTVRVNMGIPVLKPRDIPVNADGESFIMQKAKICGRTWELTAVSMGNPHAVIFTEGVRTLDLPAIGPAFENHPLFPERTNTEFVEVIDDRHLLMRVWERGAGETLACGTGASASLVAGVLCGKCARKAELELLGGKLEIEWNESDNCVYMTGGAEFVFDGELAV